MRKAGTQPASKRGLPGARLVLLFILAALMPLAAAHLTGLESTGGLQELGTALGLTAAGLLFLQFLSSGRYESLSGRTGIDRTIGFHRIAAYVLLLFALLHPLAYVAATALIDPGAALPRLTGMLTSPRLGTGVAALAGLVLLVGFAVLRERVKVSYEIWRASHGLMAATAAGLTLHHAISRGVYSPVRPLSGIWTGLAVIAFGALSMVYFVRPWRMWRQGWRVDKVKPLGDRSWEITLRAPAAARFDFSAGQFIWLTMAPYRPPFHDHPFSIASAANELPELRLIVREAGDCTNDFGRIEPGTRVAVDGPHGSFTLGASGRTVVMVAGGVGIAPLLGMLEQAALARDRRSFRLLYAARRPSELSGLERLRELQSVIDLEVGYFVDTGACEPEFARAPIGAAQLSEAIGSSPPDAVAYVCGPPRMMEQVTDLLLELRVPAEAIHYERFDFAAGRGRIDRARTRQALAIFAVLSMGMVLFALR
ncbi:MAG: ferric reductase-like transmembrane domain-containing protein [Hyphomicrobiaceae bacterium]